MVIGHLCLMMKTIGADLRRGSCQEAANTLDRFKSLKVQVSHQGYCCS